MRWRRGPRSESLEDRRAEGGRRLGAPSIGIGGLLLLLAASYFFGQDLLTPVLEQTQTLDVPAEAPPGGPPAETSPEEEERVDFVSFVIDDLQATWTKLLPDYRPAKLVLFRGAIQSGCGYAQAAMGPFYCPVDEKVYIDLAFYEELRRRFGAPGDFAQAYVIAHEVGHHVQKLLGIEQEVRRAQRARPNAANVLSVRMELQADCLAGVWGHSTARRDILEGGDVEEGLGAAAAIGDDRIQRQTTGEVQPEGFTHGSSEQRVAWFRRGLESGDPDRCDTFRETEP
jgi:predicted metalloprotease